MKRLLSYVLAFTLLSGTLLLPACSSGGKQSGTSAVTTVKKTPTTSPGTTAEKPNVTTPSEGEDTSMTPDTFDQKATVYDLRVESMVNPVGLDDTSPVFSWKTNSDWRGWMQSAYQLVVKEGDVTVWDSGKVEARDSVGIVYAGEALLESTEYTWRVTVWDNNGEKTTSEEATFEMGLFGRNAFSDAKFISYEEAPLSTETKYTIDFDFVIHKDNFGFCFGMKDTGSFVMWQINT